MEGISEECAVNQAATGSAQPEPVVSVRGLVKRYGSREAVAGIDLEVRRGEIFACLGPNGAGKPNIGFWQFFARPPRPRGQQPRCALAGTPATAWSVSPGVCLRPVLGLGRRPSRPGRR